MFREWIAHRDLFRLLVLREIRVRYARAFLGAVWAVLPPLAMMGMFTLLSFQRLVREGSDFSEVPYPLFAYCGILPWMHFSGSLNQATPSLANSRDLLRKAAFPREVLPLSKVFSGLLDFLLGSVFLVLLLLAYGYPPGLPALAVPAVFLLQVMFTMGIAAVASAANLYFRDVGYLMQFALLFGMFLTSVIYPVESSRPWVQEILRWNPMSSFLDFYREALLLGRFHPARLVPALLGTGISFAGGMLLFRRLSPRFAEEA